MPVNRQLVRGLVFAVLGAGAPALVRTQDLPAVTIVLPPRLVANARSTLAVLGFDGHLAPNITVQIGPAGHTDQYVTTDATGRAAFTAPAEGVFIAQAAGSSGAALVDAELPANGGAVSVPPAVSLRDRFALCGGGFAGDAAANRVTANGDAMFVLAASPECLVALPQPRTLYGRATLEIESPGARATATTALVALDFSPPNPPLVPGQESVLSVRAEGSAAALRIVVENGSPGVLTFLGGDTRELTTSGGGTNLARVEVKAIRSGDFSFHARLLPTPDPASAARFLQVAAGIAPKSQQSKLKRLASQFSNAPKDSSKARRTLDQLASTIPPSPLRTLIDAARADL